MTEALKRYFDLTGKTALITGATRGIGFGLAAGLAQAGAQVIVNGRDEASLAQASERLTKAGVSAETLCFDVRDHQAVVTAIDRYEADTGPVDILVNNAGVQHRQALEAFEPEKFRDVMETNATSLFYTGQAVVRHMKQRGHGKIVNIASIMTKMARHHVGAYITAKAAVGGLTRAMTAEWAGYGINCNAIGPGYISTELTQALFEDKAFSDWLTGATPAGRWGQVDDLVGAAIYLSAPASDFMHGQILYIDGGMTTTV
jgi:gluconate 5-dehydrogenase